MELVVGEAGVEVVSVLGSGIWFVLCTPGITWESSGRREVTNFTLLLPLPWLGTPDRAGRERERTQSITQTELTDPTDRRWWDGHQLVPGHHSSGEQEPTSGANLISSSPLQIENAKKTGVLVSTNQGYHSIPGQVSQQKHRNYFPKPSLHVLLLGPGLRLVDLSANKISSIPANISDLK